MKTTSIILSILLLSSCYTYKAFDPEEYAAEMANGNQPTSPKDKSNSSRTSISGIRKAEKKASKNKKTVNNDTLAKKATDIPPINITDIIKPDQFYKVEKQDKKYKIEAKQWKADTLYAVVKGTKRELKFHKDEISSIKIRKFSKGKSDALTVAAYAMGGAAALLLLK